MSLATAACVIATTACAEARRAPTSPAAPLVFVSPARAIARHPGTATRWFEDKVGRPVTVPYIQASRTLTLRLNASARAPYRAEVVVRGDNHRTVRASTRGRSITLRRMQPGTYRATVALVAPTGVRGPVTDSISDIGIGSVYIVLGDSISEGYAGLTFGPRRIDDWTEAPRDSTSPSLRQFPQFAYITRDYRASFLTSLATRLERLSHAPVLLMNEAYARWRWSSVAASTDPASGFRDGLSGLPVARHLRRVATAIPPNGWLIDAGTNDSGADPTPPAAMSTEVGSTIDHLERFYGARAGAISISRIGYALSEPYRTNAVARNHVLARIVSSRHLRSGPDFYRYFRVHRRGNFHDSIHPTARGEEAIARLWALALGAATPAARAGGP